MEIGNAVVMDKGVKGKVVKKNYEFRDGVRFVVIEILNEHGVTKIIKIRET